MEFCCAAVLGAMCAGLGIGVGLRAFSLPESILLGFVGVVVGGVIGFLLASQLLAVLFLILSVLFPPSRKVRAAAIGLALTGVLIQYLFNGIGFWGAVLCFVVYLILSLIVCECIAGTIRMVRGG